MLKLSQIKEEIQQLTLILLGNDPQLLKIHIKLYGHFI
jgi:hypothetical protein